ncbi:MAG TPA: ATP-binding protein, partial [Nannocystis sp.]
EEALGAPLDILIPEPLRERHRQYVEASAREGVTARHMGRETYVVGRRRGGELFPADAAISRLEVGGKRILTAALRDVTAQKRIEDEQRFLAEIGPVLATSLDYEDTIRRIAEIAVARFADLCTIDLVEGGEVRRVEVACRDPARRWLCDHIRDLAITRDRPHMMQSVLQTRKPLLMQRPSPEDIAALAQSEEHLRALQGAEIHSLVAVPLLVRDKLLGALAFVSSTPERTYGPADVRLAEEIAQRAALSIENAQLFRAAQRATQARDEVLAVVAHDLRNPIASVLMHVAALRRTGDEERRRRSLSAIERAATRMDSLVADLFDLACMEAGRLSMNPRPVAARQLVLDAFDAHRPQAAEASIELRLDLVPELPEVWADRDRVLQVFENLITNALKFTDPGGRITLGARPRGGEVLLWVADTGCGIPPDQLPHVFDRYWRAARAERRSAGLGLCIVKGVVDAHGGRIWAESAPGVGSTFFFTLPTHKEASRSPAAGGV